MIKKLLGKVFPGRIFRGRHPKVVPHSVHRIDNGLISPCALKTTETLQLHHHTAFIVGGAVRDLLLGRKPKDFDVATSATPEEVRRLFRRSRIIGRRFRLVHVMCGPETVEVATYRGVAGEENGGQHVADEHGRILRDNVFGTQEEDAARRDFTINALFYDPVSRQIIDYHDGVADLKHRRLRMIGDPVKRYREDPIRLLRAVRIAAGCGLAIEAKTRRPIRSLADLLASVPPSRLFDEMLKLLLSGHALDCVKRLREEGLHHGVLPMLDVILEQPLGERFVMLALKNTDERIAAGKPVSPGFLFAALLWHEVLAASRAVEARGIPPIPALYQAMEQVLQAQSEKLAIHRRFVGDMKEIWALQPRFEQRAGRRPYRLFEHPRFRAAYDFLLLRCGSGETDPALGEWWERFQREDEAGRQKLLVVETGEPRKRRRRRRKPRSHPGEAGGAPGGETP